MKIRVFVILVYLCKFFLVVLRKFIVCVIGLVIRIRISNVFYSIESFSYI